MAHNPELADELFTESIGYPWRRWIKTGFIEIGDIPWRVAREAWAETDRKYRERLMDHADYHRKAQKERV
jgi:hypothetical protein